YKISAVDRSENESELSDAICFDNCPYYELPNVFSPNGDGCNDRFSAYSNRGSAEAGEEGCTTSEESKAKCARFVKKVKFSVYNRWGKEVYRYESSGERTIFIDWDGRAIDGSDLATGVYFYVADVTFDSADPNRQYKTLKGWVHLVR
ncbi:MAG: gliding motility-associated C-terminal domain-containing protein, partial [Bacteroidota bacterium]